MEDINQTGNQSIKDVRMKRIFKFLKEILFDTHLNIQKVFES